MSKKSNSFIIFSKSFSILIWPLITLFFAMKDCRKDYAKNLLWLFCIFYGMIHIVFNDVGYYVDGMSYAFQLKDFYQYDSSWDSLMNSLYQEGSRNVDIFIPILTFMVSRFTDNYRVLFVILAFIFGFFYSRNTCSVYKVYKGKMTAFIAVIFFVIALTLPIYQINGRFWLAMHVFFYAVFPYVFEGSKKKLLFAFAAPFIHFSFIVGLVILFFYVIGPKSTKTCFVLLCLSFLITYVNLEFLNSVFKQFLPAVFDSKMDTYASTEYLSYRAENDTQAMHVVFAKFISTWIFRFVLFFTYIFHKDIIDSSKSIRNLFCLACLVSFVASILAMIPSAGRFLTLEILLVMPVILYVLNFTGTKKFMNQGFKVVFSLFFIYFIFYQLRSMSELVGVSIIYSNPFMSLINEDNMPILYLIK